MSITFDSKFVYIMGISGAYTHDEAKEIATELLKAVEAAQQCVQRTCAKCGNSGKPITDIGGNQSCPECGASR